MRKIGFALALILMIVVASVAFAPERRSEANAASLAVLHGALDAQKSGLPAFEPAFDGDLLASGDMLRADEAGNAVLAFFDGSTLTVESGTQVKVLSLSPSAGGIQATIEQGIGRTWASVAKLSGASTFELRTPTATAVVRGTTFETIVESVGGVVVTTVRTGQGVVLVQAAAGGSTIVPAGFEVQIAAGAAAPANPAPQAPGPRLRFSAPANFDFTVIDPRGFRCGSAAPQIPGCDIASGTVTIRRPVAGTYLVAVTASAATNGILTLEGGRGDATDFAVRFAADLAAGELVRTAVRIATSSTAALSTTGFSPAERLSSICAAETTGTVFSAGGIDARTSALRSFARSNPGRPVALVLTGADLEALVRESAAQAGLPVTVSNLSAGVGRSGVRVSGRVGAGPLGIEGSVSLVAATRAGRVTVRARDVDFGLLPVPGAVRDQIDTALSGVNGYIASLGISVDRIAFRDGCVALNGIAH